MCFPNAKQLAVWARRVGAVVAVDFLEGHCSYTNGMQTLCKKVKTYLRSIFRENRKGINISLGT